MGRPAFGAVLALTVAAALGAFGAIAAIAHIALPATALPAPFPAQHQDAETLAFVLAFAVILPLAAVFVPRLASRVAGSSSADAFSALSAALSGLLLIFLLIVKGADRFTSADGPATLLALAALWCLIAAAILARAVREGIPAFLTRALPPGRLGPIWASVGVLAILALLAFVELSALPSLVVGAGLIIAAGVLYAYIRGIRGRGSRWVDAGAIVLLLFAVPNLLVIDTSDPYQARIIDFHQNFFLGPANHVLGGGAMLVDTLSQYGVASIYLLAGWFQIAPIGNGTLGFFEGVLSALVFVAAYLTMRLAGASRVVSATAMTVAVIALVYGLVYPLGGLLQHGAIRFGLPVIPLLAATLEFARPRFARPAQAVQLIAVGLASIWALEAFAYTFLTMAAIIAVRTWLAEPRAERVRVALRWSGLYVAACLIAHVLFALGTLIAVGELPDWGWYLNTLREFLTGSIGDLTYDFLPWSPALVVGAFYMASACATVLVFHLRPDLARSRPATMVALAGSTAYGVALLSYFVNRSAGHILPYVCLPAFVAGAIWLSFLLSRERQVPIRVRAAGLGASLFVVVMLVGTAWSGAGERFSQSALAYAVPGGGPSLSEGLDRLWNPPDLIEGASEGATALEQCMPGESASYVLTDADLSIEIVDKAGRHNAFPFGDPWEDSFVPDQHLDELQQAVDDLRPGDRILIDRGALETLHAYRRDPDRDPLTDPFGEETIVPTGIAKLQELLIKEIGERYLLRPVCRMTTGTSPGVVTLEDKPSSRTVER